MVEPLSPLPLLLHETPPGLQLALGQEGVAHRIVRDPNPLAFRAGRFVLFDGRSTRRSRLDAMLGPDHVLIDIDTMRAGESCDPFAALIDTRASATTWTVGGRELTERVARRPRAAIRLRLMRRLREVIVRAGGAWVRIAPYPHPNRSAFNLRVDLDEPAPDDYMSFAAARHPIEDCTTHFVSTRAYGLDHRVLDDLRGLDVQSHGHHHVVYRDPEANRRNLALAHRSLVDNGFDPVGFAAPEGRWNEGLDRAVEELGYVYGSEFAIGHDDLPFFPWRDGRFSRVLQVPIHPICEGLFLDAGAEAGTIADYLVGVARAKVHAGEPAFVYGHPERRLGRFPQIVERVAEAVEDVPLLWRTTLTEFARWWRWRAERRWGIVARDDGTLEVQFEEWDAGYPMALEIVRGEHVASIPVTASRQTLRLDALAYERTRHRADVPDPTHRPRPRGLSSVVRSALDWETVTPIDELPEATMRDRVKKRLRRWRATTGGRT